MSETAVEWINSEVPNPEARCIRCGLKLSDKTWMITRVDPEDHEPRVDPVLVGYFCTNKLCTAFGLLTVAMIP